jgi:hypothetical protein
MSGSRRSLRRRLHRPLAVAAAAVLLGGAVAAVVVGAGTAPASSPTVSATRPGG